MAATRGVVVAAEWGGKLKTVIQMTALGFLLAPLLFGIVNRTKAFFAGRIGQPLLQPYFDLWKLLRKGAVYSRTTTWVFRAGPLVGLAAVMTCVALTPLGGVPTLAAFPGDFVLLAGLLGLTDSGTTNIRSKMRSTMAFATAEAAKVPNTAATK